MDFVQLNRTFIEFSNSEADESYIDRFGYSALLYKKLTWSDLLKNKSIVILGEAGIGKTREFREQEKVLKKSGKFAFFIDVSSLINEELSEALDLNEYKQLETWLNTEEEALFFLDSVDEGRLRDPKALEIALKKLRKNVGNHWGLTRLIISCRVSEWQYITDRSLIEDTLSPLNRQPNETDLTKKGQEDKSNVKVFQMTPLNTKQISIFAGALGVTDTEKFLQDILEANADIFVGRPMDVEWIAQYWMRKHCLGTLTELMEYNITEKLIDVNPEHRSKDFSLSPKRLREGVESLAAAVIFCKCPSILLPDPEPKLAKSSSTIDPNRVLADWNVREIQTLLMRPIFDEAIYGRVRFHHRSVTEYLAAQWIVKIRNSGCNLRNIENLFFYTIHGRPVLIPSRMAVAGWASGAIPEIGRKILSFEPEAILLEGDPQNISLEERDFALRQLTEKYKNRKHLGWWLDRSKLHRIGEPGLTSTINFLLTDYRDTVDIREMLLEIIELGKLSGCADIALSIVLNDTEDEYVRVQAIRTVKAINNHENLLKLSEFVRTTSNLSNTLTGVLCESLFPGYLSVFDCLALLSLTKMEMHNRITSLRHAFEDYVPAECPKENAVELIEGLMYLAIFPPVIKCDGEVFFSVHFWWLPRVIAKIFVKLLQDNSPQSLPLDIVKDAFYFLYQCKSSHNSDIEDIGITEELRKHCWLRRELYWDYIKKHQREDNKPVFLHYFDALCPLSEEDIKWIIEDIKSMQLIENKQQALQTAFLNFAWSKLEKIKDSILEAVKDDAELYQLAQHYFNPNPAPAIQLWEQNRQEKKKKEDEKRQLAFEKLKERLQKDVQKIRSGNDFRYLWYLVDYARENYHNHSHRWGIDAWQSLIPNFGNEIAEAAKEGFKAYWRKWKPPLPHEIENQNQTEYGVVVGLTGLIIEAGEGLDFACLSTEEAKIATHYSMREMNGFPEWFPRLMKAHPDIVRDILFEVFKAELYPNPTISDCRFIWYVEYSTEEVIDFCAPILFKLFEYITPFRPQIVSKFIRVIHSTRKIETDKITRYAEQRTRLFARHCNSDLLLLWLVSWMHVDSANAWNFVEGFIKDNCCDVFSTVESFITSLAAALREPFGRERALAVIDYLKPSILRRMIPVFYYFIRPEDDVWHEDAYSPDIRDHAERFRSWLPQKLSEIEGKEAHATLLALADDPKLNNQRDWFLNLADKHAENAAEQSPWEPNDIIEFARNYEKEPQTASELFSIVIARFDDLQAHIETGDFSERGLFKAGIAEEEIQKWFAARLRDQSKKMYTVHREEEVDLKKKPDIRLHHPRSGSVGIEVKPNNRYSYNALKDALITQLIGQYLRAIESRYGILLLAKLKNKKYDTGDGREHINFEQLVIKLNELAFEIVEKDNEIDSVKVIGIDFTQPIIGT